MYRGTYRWFWVALAAPTALQIQQSHRNMDMLYKIWKGWMMKAGSAGLHYVVVCNGF